MSDDNLPMKIDDLSLSVEDIRFVGEYCANGFNAVQAMKDLKMVDEMTTDAQIHLKSLKIVNRPTIKTAIQRFVDATMAPYQDRIRYQLLDVWRARAFYDLAVFYYPDGSAKPLSEIPREYRQAIDSITEDFKGKNADVRVVNYKLADRSQASKNLQELLTGGSKEQDNPLETGARNKLESIFAAVAKAGADAAISGVSSQKRKNDIEKATPADFTIVGEDLPRAPEPVPVPKIKTNVRRKGFMPKIVGVKDVKELQ